MIVIVLSLLLGQKAIVIGSSSMKPTLEPGDLVLELQRGPANASPGEIVSFSEPGSGRTLTRRVIAGAPEGRQVRLIAKADNADTIDNITVPRDGLIGFPLRSIPWGGRVVEALDSPAALLIIPGLIVLLIAFSDLRRRREEVPGSGAF